MRYERKYWQRGPCDWLWQVRETNAMTSFADGRASGPSDANRKIREAIAQFERRHAAMWKPVEV